MPLLDDATLYEAALPPHLQPTLELLTRLQQAARCRDAAAVPPLHDAALAAGASLPVSAIDLRDAEQAFVSGALRVARYEQTVLCADVPVVDTAGSRTLSAFRSDLAELSEAQVRAALIAAFQPEPALLDRIDARIAEESGQLALRHAIILALDTLFPLRPAQDSQAQIMGLFGALYPHHPLHPEEVKVIRTGTALFFCLPHDGERLTTRAPEDPQDEAVRTFLRGLLQFHPHQAAHFPSFGSLHRETVPARLCEQISAHSGVSVAVVAATLPTMVVVLPLEKVDQYIVHDAWGHGWQALLFRFEETYQRVATYTQLPSVDAVFQRPDGPPVCLREVLTAAAAGGEAWRSLLEDWLRAATAERLYDALANLSAEVIADVVEYKFLAQNPDQSGSMPSSSFVKGVPTKLDLTLWDLPMYYGRALEGFRRLGDEPAAVPRLAAGWGVSAAVVQAVAAHTGDWLRRVHGEADGTSLGAETTPARVALCYLAIHVRFNQVYAALKAADPGVGFADVLVFCVAAWLEEDWAARFWQIDGLLMQFASLYQRFRAAL